MNSLFAQVSDRAFFLRKITDENVGSCEAFGHPRARTVRNSDLHISGDSARLTYSDSTVAAPLCPLIGVLRCPSSSCLQQASRRTFARYSPTRKRAICWLGFTKNPPSGEVLPADRRICVSSLAGSRGGRSKARFPPARLLHAGGR